MDDHKYRQPINPIIDGLLHLDHLYNQIHILTIKCQIKKKKQEYN